MLAMSSIATFAQTSVASDGNEEKTPITQHSWEEYDWVDTCTTKYAVVHDWIGRCGIYDLEKHENLTELEYHQLYYSQDLEL